MRRFTAGQPGFLLGDMTGLGKTLSVSMGLQYLQAGTQPSVWCAVVAIPERDILIVCPKGAIPQ
jgi:hypothetical protein